MECHALFSSSECEISIKTEVVLNDDNDNGCNGYYNDVGDGIGFQQRMGRRRGCELVVVGVFSLYWE